MRLVRRASKALRGGSKTHDFEAFNAEEEDKMKAIIDEIRQEHPRSKYELTFEI